MPVNKRNAVFHKIFSSAMALCFVASSQVVAPGANAKNAKPALSAAKKAEMRKRGFEWCRKKYISGGAYIVRVEIMNDGRVRCWFKS
jgi:hypothetical protein